MSLRAFLLRRNAQPGDGSTVVVPPVIQSAIIGSNLSYVSAAPSGVLQPTIILSEVLDETGGVLTSAAGAYVGTVAVAGKTYRLRQTFTLLGVQHTLVSAPRASEVAAVDIDIGDWYIPTPVAVDTSVYALDHIQQPGSRLHFFDPETGALPAEITATGAFRGYYLWNGTNIIDHLGNTAPTTGTFAGVPYGTDPMLPSASVIKVRHWCSVGPTRNFMPYGVRTGDSKVGSAGNVTADGVNQHPRRLSAEWYLFPRGKTMDLWANLQDYKTYCPAYIATDSQLLGFAGRSPTEQTVYCAYGPMSGARPKLQMTRQSALSGDCNFFDRSNATSTGFNHTVVMDLHFDMRTRAAGTTGAWRIFLMTGQTGVGNLLSGCLAEAGAIGDLNTNFSPDVQIKLYRSACVDNFVAPGSAANISGAHNGAGLVGKLTVHGCLFARNAYNGADPWRIEGGEVFPTWTIDGPSGNGWPQGSIVVGPNGEKYVNSVAIAAGVPFADTAGNYGVRANQWQILSDNSGRRAMDITNRNRNWYINGDFEGVENLVARGSSGEQLRNGRVLLRNYIQAGYLLWGNNAPNATDTSTFPGRCEDNVLELLYSVYGHTARGLALGAGPREITVRRNLFSRAAIPTLGSYAVSLYYSGSQFDPGAGEFLGSGTRNNTIEDNVFDCGNQVPFELADGVRPGGSAQPAMSIPAVTGNVIRNNKIASSNVALSRYTPYGDAPATNDTVFELNTVYASVGAMLSAMGGTDATRTLKSYLISQGVVVNSFDGVHELVQLFMQQRRGVWDDRWTAKPVINYVRAGRGMPLLP